jgi:hypothetical protein
MEGAKTQLKLKNYLFNKKGKQEYYFHHEYKNYSNYSKFTKPINFSSTVNFGLNVNFDFNKEGMYGDLISNIVLEFELPNVSSLKTTTGSKVGYTNSVGNALIKKLVFKIGGNIIEQHNSEYMDIISTMNVPYNKTRMYNYMIKRFDSQSVDNFKGGKVQIPLMLWFCQVMKENNNMVLPLIALNRSKVELFIELRSLSELLIYEDTSSLTSSQLSGLSIGDSSLMIDYILLEDEERLRYLNAKKQFYLITQSQFLAENIDADASATNLSLRSFKYPIIELFWVIRKDTNKDANNYFNYTNNFISDYFKEGFITKGKLLFNNIDRTEELSSDFFSVVEPFKYHDNYEPSVNINMYSFSNDPADISQPVGTCNFSNIYDPRLVLTLKNMSSSGEILVYGINYNILQINEDGQAYLLHTLSKSTPETLKAERQRDLDNIDNSNPKPNTHYNTINTDTDNTTNTNNNTTQLPTTTSTYSNTTTKPFKTTTTNPSFD